MASKFTIRAVLFQHGDHWVAQCLEYDIATQAKTMKKLMYEIQSILVAHLLDKSETPFEGIPQAPKRFWDLYQQAAADLTPVEPHRALEDAADDALLPPHLSRSQFPVGEQAGDLGTGAGAARRPVIRLARAEDEVATVSSAPGSRRAGSSRRRRSSQPAPMAGPITVPWSNVTPM